MVVKLSVFYNHDTVVKLWATVHSYSNSAILS